MSGSVYDLTKSRYLTQGNCEPPIVVTINQVVKENVAPSGALPDMQYVVKFTEPETKEGLVLKPTNGKRIARINGSDNFDDWHRTQICLYRDPDIEYAGKITGGIRVRAIDVVVEPEAETEPEFDDEIRF